LKMSGRARSLGEDNLKKSVTFAISRRKKEGHEQFPNGDKLLKTKFTDEIQKLEIARK